MCIKSKGKIGCSIVLYVGLLVATLTGCTSDVTPQALPTPTLTIAEAQRSVPDTLPGEQSIVPYPGAEDVETDDSGAPTGRIISFTSKDSPDRVQSFYETTYTNKGWKVVSSGEIVWQDDAGTIPWTAKIKVFAQQTEQGNYRYSISTKREADPDNVPVIRGASNIHTFMAYSWFQGLEDLENHPAIVFSYTITLSADDVLDTYEYQLLTYGWEKISRGPDELRLQTRGGPRDTAVVRAYNSGAGETRVLVGAAGYDLNPLKDTNGYNVYGPQDAYTHPVIGIAHLRPPPLPDIPLYPDVTNGEVTDANRWASNLYDTTSVKLWDSERTQDEIRNYYTNTLTREGWKQVSYPKEGWYWYTYKRGAGCQSRQSLYLIFTDSRKGRTSFTVITTEGCNIITGDEKQPEIER